MILVQEQKKRPMKEKNKFKTYSNVRIWYVKKVVLQWEKTTQSIMELGPLANLGEE